MLDVFFYEAYEEEDAALRRFLPAMIRAEYSGLTVQETGHQEPPTRLISIRNQSLVPHDWAPRLDAILTRSTGYDHLLAYAATAKSCPALGFLPLYCHRAVAEQAMLLWMALLRRLPQQMRQFHTFDRDGLAGGECAGRTLVVVGVGNIGQEICKIGQALGMRVLAVDREPRFADVEYVEIGAALPQADVVATAMDLNRSNVGYFDLAKWRRVKPGAVFVNIARGELSPASALLAALDAGFLGGVGLDVFEHEPELSVALRAGQPTNDPEIAATLALAQREDCVLTPHNAFNSVEALGRKGDHSVQQVVAWLETGKFLWPVVASEI